MYCNFSINFIYSNYRYAGHGTFQTIIVFNWFFIVEGKIRYPSFPYLVIGWNFQPTYKRWELVMLNLCSDNDGIEIVGGYFNLDA